MYYSPLAVAGVGADVASHSWPHTTKPLQDIIWEPVRDVLAAASMGLVAPSSSTGVAEAREQSAFSASCGGPPPRSVVRLPSASLRNQMRWYAHVMNGICEDHTIAPELHHRLAAWVGDELTDRFLPRLRQLSDAALVVTVAELYCAFTKLTRLASLMFGYMDKYFEFKSAFLPVRRLFFQAFARVVFSSVKERAAVQLVRMISARRLGGGAPEAAAHGLVCGGDALLRVALQMFAQMATFSAGAWEETGACDAASGHAPHSGGDGGDGGSCLHERTAGDECGHVADYEVTFFLRYERSIAEELSDAAEQRARSGSGSSASPCAAAYFGWCQQVLRFEAASVIPFLHNNCRARATQSILGVLLPKKRCVEMLGATATTGLQTLLRRQDCAAVLVINDVLRRLPAGAGLRLLAKHVIAFGEERFQQCLNNFSEALRREFDGVPGHSASQHHHHPRNRQCNQQEAAATNAGRHARTTNGSPELCLCLTAAERDVVDDLLRCVAALDVVQTEYFAGAPALAHCADTAMRRALNGVLYIPADPGASGAGVGVPTDRVPSVLKSRTLAELLPMYIDALVRDEIKGALSSEEQDHQFASIARLAAALEERDVFEEGARFRLARRLLQRARCCVELERELLSKLNAKLSVGFSRRMEAMLRDCEAAATLCADFVQQGGATGNIEFSAHVLTRVHWPSYRASPLTLPDEVSAVVASFHTFYLGSYPNRTLVWLHNLGTSSLVIRFPLGTKEVLCSHFQAAILLTLSGSCRDGRSAMRCTEIAATLGADWHRDVAPNVDVMVRGRNFPILQRRSAAAPLTHDSAPSIEDVVSGGGGDTDDADADDDETVEFNPGFTNKVRKLKLPPPRPAGLSSQLRVAAGTAEAPASQLRVQRQVQVDAAMVRVLKTRRKCATNELFELTTSQLQRHFIPNQKLLRERLEELLHRGFADRVPAHQGAREREEGSEANSDAWDEILFKA